MSVGSLVELAAKVFGKVEGAKLPATEDEAKAMLIGTGPGRERDGALLVSTGDFGPTGTIIGLLVPKATGGGYWLADKVTIVDPPGACAPADLPLENVTLFDAAFAPGNEPHVVAPYFACDDDANFVGRRIYETWVDRNTGTQVRIVRKDDRKDQAELGASTMQLGYWEVCNQLFKVEEPTDVVKVAPEDPKFIRKY